MEGLDRVDAVGLGAPRVDLQDAAAGPGAQRFGDDAVSHAQSPSRSVVSACAATRARRIRLATTSVVRGVKLAGHPVEDAAVVGAELHPGQRHVPQLPALARVEEAQDGLPLEGATLQGAQQLLGGRDRGVLVGERAMIALLAGGGDADPPAVRAAATADRVGDVQAGGHGNRRCRLGCGRGLVLSVVVDVAEGLGYVTGDLGVALDRMQQLAGAKARTRRPLGHPGTHHGTTPARRCGSRVALQCGLVEVAGVVLQLGGGSNGEFPF